MTINPRLGFPTGVLSTRIRLFAAVLLALSPMVAAPVGAQTPAPPAKVEELIRLLADPEVRTWIDAQSAAPAPARAPAPATDTAADTAASPMSRGIDALRASIAATAAAVPSLPGEFHRAGSQVMDEIDQRGPLIVLGLVAGFILAGLALNQIVYATTARFRRWMISQPRHIPGGRVRALFGRLLYATIMLGVYAAGSVGLFLIFDWPDLLREIVLALLVAAIIGRAALMTGRALLVPPQLGVPDAIDYRVLPLDDATARHWYFWLPLNVALLAFLGSVFLILARLGFDPPARHVLRIPAGLIAAAVALAAVWTRPRRAGSIGGMHPVAVSWLLTVFVVLLLVLRVLGMHVEFWFAAAVVGLPALIVLAHRAVLHVLRPPAADLPDEAVQPVTIAVIDRGIRVALIALAAAFLARLVNFDMMRIGATDAAADRLARGVLNALIIILAADFAWSLIKAIIARRLGPSPNAAPGHEAEPGTDTARVRTLLPIIQNILFAALVVIALLMVLSSLGVEIAPLIAGAGIVGVAVGFGAQTLVKDVISGIFYLFDDAFRVGHYIQSKSYKGTVESFSLRSVKLRHHRGYLFIVPFSELGAVQNMTTDFVIEKFSVTVDYETDLELARRTIKKIGLAMAENPEFAPHFIEPLKLQGVENFGDYGIELRLKMVTTPGQQFVIRRRAYLEIQKAFQAAGIRIPFPTVHVQAGADPATAAASVAVARAAPGTVAEPEGA